MLRGIVREEPPLDPGLNWRHEAEVLSNLRGPVEEESRRPEVLKKLRNEARSRMGPAGTPPPPRAPQRPPRPRGKDPPVARGRPPPPPTGFPNNYSLTQPPAEHAAGA